MSEQYPIWWDTTITIYNQYEDPQTFATKWYRTVVNNCFWKYAGERILINDVEIDTNSVICRIPESDSFVEKYLWNQLADEEKSNYFTLGRDDIIIPGNVTDEINDYQDGKRATDLLAKYARLQGCMKMQTIVLNVGIGRNNPHYYVTGDRG